MAEARSREADAVVVVYALPEEQHLVTIAWESGLTAAQAVQRSGLPERFAQIDQTQLVLGNYGRPIDADQVVERGMRIEICRPLQRDPRELRRIMMSQGRVVGQRATEE